MSGYISHADQYFFFPALVASGCLLLALMLFENLKLLHECVPASLLVLCISLFSKLLSNTLSCAWKTCLPPQSLSFLHSSPPSLFPFSVSPPTCALMPIRLFISQLKWQTRQQDSKSITAQCTFLAEFWPSLALSKGVIFQKILWTEGQGFNCNL